MATEKQIAANRLNAQKSTGPRTPEGKARCRYNALKHGLLSRSVIIPGKAHNESRADFDALLNELIDELRPAGALEHFQVEKIAVCYWRLQRAVRAESLAIHKHNIEQAARRARLDEFDRRFARFTGHPEAVPARQNSSPDPKNCETDPIGPEEYPLPSPNTFLPLLRYETAIDRQLQKALDRLERLQSLRRRRSGFRSAADPETPDSPLPPTNDNPAPPRVASTPIFAKQTHCPGAIDVDPAPRASALPSAAVPGTSDSPLPPAAAVPAPPPGAPGAGGPRGAVRF